MKKLQFFAMEYTKLRIFVAFGFRRTSFPLYVKWWWQRPGYLKPNATIANRESPKKTLPDTTGNAEKID